MSKPTMKIEDGAQVWRLPNGKCHREGNPAYIKESYQAWYLNGLRHCINGPAIINKNYQAWFINGKLHREDGPAIINGNEEYWVNGERHREDGPAVIDGDRKEYWLNDKKITDQFQYWFLVGELNLEKL